MQRQEDFDKELDRARRELDANPTSAVAHLRLADALRHRGDAVEAIALYRACAAVDAPAIAVPAQYFIAALGAAAPPSASPGVFVSALFDLYADTFEQELVQVLKYTGPPALDRAVRAVLGEDADDLDVLDAGCDTGLYGALFRPLARSLDGVDIADGMLRHAREKNIYDELAHGDICEFLAARPFAYDLVLAADVLIYLGDLAPVLAAVMGSLRRGGLFAFTTERGDEGYRLTANGRFTHGDAYIEAMARDAGFDIAHMDDLTVRFEKGLGVDGAVFVLTKP